MARRVCPDCKTIHDPKATGARAGRCPNCSRIRDRERGSRADRGYGWAHQSESRQWQAKVDRGERVMCWRCGERITGRVNLGHDDHDRTITRGPEHERCNLSAAGSAKSS